MKNTKRILEVKIVRAMDTDPDTSYYGEYSNKPDSEFSIDRATDEFQGDIDNGRDWLDRIETRLQYEYDELNEDATAEDLPETDWMFMVDQAMDTVRDLRNDAPFDSDSTYWNSREYRYFNPNVSNYQGEPAEDIRKYSRQDFERMESYNNQHWHYTGTYAVAEVQVAGNVVQTVRSGGLWGTESDAGQSHFEEIEQEQLSELRDQLKALGFSTRAISVAFKQVVRGEE